MDSLTQLTFGAACGEAVLGKRIGRKALVWGAVLGTLPDLDVFIPLGGPVNDFVYHRGFSHSLILLAFLSPVIAWLISRVHSDSRQYYGRWVLLSLLVLEASVLLDLLTIYGTQIFWPFDTTPMAVPILFITVGDYVAMTDLRMGSEPDYVFRFKVARLKDSHPVPIDDERLQTALDWRGLAWVWKRIWNPIPQS